MIIPSDEFYREILSHPISADLEAAKALSSNPGALDLFREYPPRPGRASRPGMQAARSPSHG
jgi:hypothetical protein